MRGRIVSVEQHLLGSELAAAYNPAGSNKVLVVEDATEFDEAGGTVIVGTDVGTYTDGNVDYDNDTITLTAALPSSWAEGTKVDVSPVAVMRSAEVQLDDLPDITVTARIPYSIYDALPLGIRSPEGQEAVILDEEEDGPLYIYDILGTVPRRSGEFILPGTFPTQPSDGLPPASSPTPSQVVGGQRWLAVKWNGVGNADPVTYDIHVIDATTRGGNPAWAVGATTKAGETSGTLAFIRSYGSGPTNLAYVTDYYIKLVAKDKDGSAAAGAESGPYRLDPVLSEDITANIQAALADSPDNMLRNGGGEEGTLGSQAPGWTFVNGYNLEVAEDQRKYGNRSLKINNAALQNSYHHQDVTVEAGKPYEISGWVRTVFLAGGSAAINIDILSGITGFTIIEKLAPTDLFGAQPDMGIPPGYDWVFVRCRFIPTGANGVLRVWLQSGYEANSVGPAWFDGVVMRRATTTYTDDLVAGAITTAKLAALAVTAAKIAANTITANEIAAGAITAEELATIVLTAAKIYSPAETGLRLEIGDPQFVMRLWDGSTYRFYLDSSGNVYVKGRVDFGLGSRLDQDFIELFEKGAVSQRVQVGSGQGRIGTQRSASWPAPTTPGNFLTASMLNSTNGAVTAPGGWTLLLTTSHAAGLTLRTYIIENAASRSGSEVWTVPNNNDTDIIIAEYAGPLTVSAIDKTATNSGTSAAPDSGTTAATVQADEAWIGFLGINHGLDDFTAPTNGFSEVVDLAPTTANGVGLAMFEKIVAATGAASVGATVGSGDWVGHIITVKSGSGLGTPAANKVRIGAVDKGGETVPVAKTEDDSEFDFTMPVFLGNGYATYAAATSTSASYIDVGGTSPASVTVTKKRADTRLLVRYRIGFFCSADSTVWESAVKEGATDYETRRWAAHSDNVQGAPCVAVISGLAEGAHTLTLRLRRVSGTGTITSDSNHSWEMEVWEVPA